MAKPSCKREGAWVHWRSDHMMSPFAPNKFTKWSKREMNRARRRHGKRRCIPED